MRVLCALLLAATAAPRLRPGPADLEVDDWFRHPRGGILAVGRIDGDLAWVRPVYVNGEAPAEEWVAYPRRDVWGWVRKWQQPQAGE